VSSYSTPSSAPSYYVPSYSVPSVPSYSIPSSPSYSVPSAPSYSVPSPPSRAFRPDSRRLSGPASEIWTSTGTVPEKLERIPDQLLEIKFGTINVAPNMTMKMSQMQSRPSVYWDAEPNALYTLLIEDLDILEEIGDVQFKHWIVTNIPGNNVAAGDETIEFLTSFAFATAEGGLDINSERTQRHQVLVYKQPRRLEAGEVIAERGCEGNWGPRFIQKRTDLVEKLGLEGPVAGNFYRVSYEKGWSEFYLCLAKRCTGRSLLLIPEPNNPRLICLREEEPKAPEVYEPACNEEPGSAIRTNQDIWTATGTVPDKLERVPDQLLQIQFGSLNISPNMTVLMSQLQSRPRLYWDAEPNTLYTVMIEDVDVLDVVAGGNTGKHWLVTNIPGNNVAAGDEVGDYLQSFFFANAEGGLDDQSTRDQRHIIMVYKQTRRIQSGELERISGCGPPAVGEGARLGPNHQSFFPRLGLEGPVAANFYRIGYQSGWSEFFVCYVKRCNGFSLIPAEKVSVDNPLRLCLEE